MKAKVKTWLNLLLSAVLGLIGISCGSCVAMYGVPSADFTLKGQVTNEENEALENIQVVLRNGWKDDTNTTYWEEGDTLYTNTEGQFYRYYEGIFPLQIYQVIANDTSGVYASDTIDSTVKYKGGSGWYEGKGKLEVEFVLKRNSSISKEEDE